MNPRLFALFLAASACTPVEVARPAPLMPPARAPASRLEPDTVEHRVGWIEFDPQWRGTSFGAYLSPKEDFADASGGVDVIFHFHGGMLAEKEWRATGVNALVVSAAFGIGSNVYAAAFTDPARFGKMIDEVLTSLKDAKGSGKLHARRIALVSWSAGYGSVSNILRVPKYFKLVDSVILLDSLHTGFTPDHRVDVKLLDPFVRLAKDAIAKKKLFVMTHSAILPPDYVSTTDSAAAVLDAVGAHKVEVSRTDRGMQQIYRVDEGDFHVRGYTGGGVKDHIDHLQAVGDLALEFIVPRWSKPDDARNAHD